MTEIVPARQPADEPLVLKFGGSLVEQLGAQLYPSVTATVAELVSNAWDAEAKNVWIEMPFGTWAADSEIVVTDDGLGMTREEAQHAYLVVGRKRRLEGRHEMSTNGLRRVHGRKGIGKLAAFGTAGILECSTLKDGQHTAFRLDYEGIRRLAPTADYTVEPAADESPPPNPDTGAPLERGTRIRLTNLLQKRSLGEDQFFRSMGRRFAIGADEMAVRVNARSLARFSVEVQFRFPRDAAPDGVTLDENGWAIEAFAEDRVVKWWIGFTAKPLDDESLQGISVLANQKMAQRPFLFDRSQGTEGQLGQEYLVGEVQADWIDTGVDVEDDLIQSNRDQLQIEDDRLTPFIEWGRRRLAWALRERNRLRAEEAISKFEASDELVNLFKPFTKAEQNQFTRIAVTASKLPEMDGGGLVDLMRSVVDANSDVAVRGMLEEITASEEAVQPRMWQLVRQFGLIDARRLLSIIEARLGTIRKLKEALATGAREVPELHETVRKDPWLLDPRWHLLDDEVDMTKLGVQFQPELDETGARLDFMFGLLPHPPATVDEVVIVEIKRGTHPNGTLRTASETEVDKFSHYVGAAQEFQQNANTRSPRVRGLMIAQGYTANGDRQRKILEKVADPIMEFKTWDRVIDETERMHLGWLEVSKLRSLEPDPAAVAAPALAKPMTAAAPAPTPAASETKP